MYKLLKKITQWIMTKMTNKKSGISNFDKQGKIQFVRGQKLGKWVLETQIPGGGNGSIWLTTDEHGSKVILKALKKSSTTARKRFLQEISVLVNNKGNSGIMTIIDHCELVNDSEFLWYVMPKANLLKSHLNNSLPEDIVIAIIDVAKTLTNLHKHKTFHRDIKPQNLFYLNGFVVIGDFGLVDFETKEKGLTLSGSPLGPRWTIAPEMRRNPELANAAKADVYSLIKTLWILLTGVEKGFEGQYNPVGSIGLQHYYRDLYLTTLDGLLINSTENDPKLRPNMDEVVLILESWLETHRDFIRRNRSQWIEIQQKLFPLVLPTRLIWKEKEAIITVLNLLGGTQSLNHMMFPDGGGMDLNGAKNSNESDCIELDCQIPYIIKPLRLIFESFGSANEWSYFRLETELLTPISIGAIDDEEVREVKPGVYLSQIEADQYYNENGSYPAGSRSVTRILKGSFVVFQKTSSYNLTPSTYDGRHDKVSADEFRDYISAVVDTGYKVEVIREEGTRGKLIKNGPLPEL